MRLCVCVCVCVCVPLRPLRATERTPMGQGYDHNADAHLTRRGWAQTAALRRHLATLHAALDVEVCVWWRSAVRARVCAGPQAHGRNAAAGLPPLSARTNSWWWCRPCGAPWRLQRACLAGAPRPRPLLLPRRGRRSGC
jgi:hypothetical protein